MKKIFSYFTIIVCLLILGNMKNAYATEIKTDDIANSTYVIGKCMFTRDISDKYSGSLSTDVIMLAAKTIDSNNLEDMIIYYKNARGIWVNALNNEQVEMNETVEIEYKNNVEYIQAPTLSNTYGNSIPGGEINSGLNVISEGAYSIDTGNLSGYEVYEKIDDKYVLINTAESDQKFTKSTLITVNFGESKIYVARVYMYNEENEKIYSDYSNEIVIDNTTLKTPTLTKVAGDATTAQLTVFFEGAYANETISISGYELYEKNGNNLTLVDTIETTFGTPVTVDVKESKIYVARVYIYNQSNEKIYSDYSNEVVVNNTILETPTLTKVAGDATTAQLTIFFEGAYANETISISGYELYEKNGNNLTLVDTIETTFGTPVTVDVKESKIYVARVYVYNQLNEKIYSDYSNEVVVNNSI